MGKLLSDRDEKTILAWSLKGSWVNGKRHGYFSRTTRESGYIDIFAEYEFRDGIQVWEKWTWLHGKNAEKHYCCPFSSTEVAAIETKWKDFVDAVMRPKMEQGIVPPTYSFPPGRRLCP